MLELMLGFGIVWTLFKQLDTSDDVSRLADKIRALEKAGQPVAVPVRD